MVSGSALVLSDGAKDEVALVGWNAVVVVVVGSWEGVIVVAGE